MKVFGHGTTTGVGHPINSRESFIELAASADSGVDGVELDVRRTADDQLVVIHDDRYSDGQLVADTVADDRPAGVILLAEALDLCAAVEVNIELKNHPRDKSFDPAERIADLCATLLDERHGADDVIVSCFGLGCIDRLLELRPQTPTALLLLSRRTAQDLIVPAVSRRHRAVHPFISMIDEDFMRRCRQFDLRVNVWSAAEETDTQIRSMMRAGVDGFITEAPERVIRIRDQAADL